MSTNYYLKDGSNKIHIGKKSFGRRFLFQEVVDEDKVINNERDLFDFLKNKIKSKAKFVDEYDRKVEINDFIDLVKSSKNESMNHERNPNIHLYHRSLLDFIDTDFY